MAISFAQMETTRAPITDEFCAQSMRTCPASARERLAGKDSGNNSVFGEMLYAPSDTSPEALLHKAQLKMERGDTAAAMKICERLLERDDVPDAIMDDLAQTLETGCEDLKIMGRTNEAMQYERLLAQGFTQGLALQEPAPQRPDLNPSLSTGGMV